VTQYIASGVVYTGFIRPCCSKSEKTTFLNYLGYSGCRPNLLELPAFEFIELFEFVDGAFDGNGI
jgi:hypothetical protein